MADLRIGDLERDAAADALSAHYAAGRLDRVELDDRLAAVYAAKTGGQLAPLFVDLPGAQVALVGTPQPRSPGRRGPSFHPLMLLLPVVLVVSTVGAIAHGFPPVFLIVAVFWVAKARRRHGWR